MLYPVADTICNLPIVLELFKKSDEMKEVEEPVK